MNTVQLSFNGQTLTTEVNTLHALLLQQAYDLDAAFACAVNQVFVPRQKWRNQSLQAGDCIDVIAPVTGG